MGSIPAGGAKKPTVYAAGFSFGLHNTPCIKQKSHRSSVAILFQMKLGLNDLVDHVVSVIVGLLESLLLCESLLADLLDQQVTTDDGDQSTDDSTDDDEDLVVILLLAEAEHSNILLFMGTSTQVFEFIILHYFELRVNKG